MKTKFWIIISVLALVLTGCSNSSDQKRIAQLEAEIAKLKGEESREIESEEDNSMDSYNDYSSTTSNESSEPQIYSSFVGIYKFKDEANKTWILSLNSDGTAQIKSGDELHYGSWKDYAVINSMHIKFDLEDVPLIHFPYGQHRGTLMELSKNGYLYAHPDAKEAKNPRKRLPVKKIK